MPRSIIARSVNSTCKTRSLTIRHLTRKLECLNLLTATADAKNHHYVQRDRVERQLIEASTYLCS